MNIAQKTDQQIKNFKIFTWVVSIAVPIVVALLFGIKIDGFNTSFLPPIYASINAITAIVLVSALYMIKKGNMPAHRRLMQFAIVLSLIFLVCYIVYHITSSSAVYGDINGNGLLESNELAAVGIWRSIYLPLLITHIAFSVIVIPLVMISYSFAWAGQFDKHKKWTRIAFPIWFFVAVSGVIVYLMISPYYA
jgi:putative membrane protein